MAALSRREALRTLGMGAALGAVSAGAVYAASPVIHDPALELCNRIEALRAEWYAIDLDTDEAAFDAFREEHFIPAEKTWMREEITPTTLAGVTAILHLMQKTQCLDDFDERLVESALRYLERETSA